MPIYLPCISQPKIGAAVLRTEGIARGITFAMTPESDQRVIAWTPLWQHAAFSGPGTVVPTGYGTAAWMANAVDLVVHATLAVRQAMIPAGGPFTVHCKCRMTSVASTYIPILMAGNAVSVKSGWLIQWNAPADRRYGFLTFGAGDTEDSMASTTAGAAGEWTFTATSDGTTKRWYVNGVEEATSVTIPTFQIGAGNNYMWWGHTDNSQAVYLGVVWNRCLGPNEVRELYLNPWGSLFAYPAVRAFDAAAAVWTQEGYRWRADDGNEAAASWLGAQDVALTRRLTLPARLRMLLDTTGGDPATQTVTLQVRKSGDPDTEWRDIGS